MNFEISKDRCMKLAKLGEPYDIAVDLGGECSNAQFVEWLREQSKEFTEEGWITESGIWWYVDEHLNHGLVAACVLADDPENENDGEAQADKRGWLRISDYGHRTARRCLTQRQIDTLWDYCEAMGYDYNRNFESIQYLSRAAKVTNAPAMPTASDGRPQT